MNAKQKYANAAPDWGARSDVYFGISLDLDKRFFHRTSSANMINPTYNPTPTPLRRHECEQRSLRTRLFQFMAFESYTKKEQSEEWRNIISDMTKLATQEFIERYDGVIEPFVPYSERTKKIMKLAGDITIAECSKQVILRTGEHGASFHTVKATMEFTFTMERQKRNVPARVRHLMIKGHPWCSCCGAKAGPEVRLHVDHIVPLAKGGSNEITNLQVLCDSCNLGKGSMW